jgi:hypothetical protein
MAEILERLAASRTAVEQVCHLLLTPSAEVLDRCSGILSGVVVNMSAGGEPVKSRQADPAILSELRELQLSVSLAGHLLEGAASFHAGWARILRSMVLEYTPRGDTGSLGGSSRLAVEG